MDQLVFLPDIFKIVKYIWILFQIAPHLDFYLLGFFLLCATIHKFQLNDISFTFLSHVVFLENTHKWNVFVFFFFPPTTCSVDHQSNGTKVSWWSCSSLGTPLSMSSLFMSRLFKIIHITKKAACSKHAWTGSAKPWPWILCLTIPAEILQHSHNQSTDVQVLIFNLFSPGY